MFRFLMAIFLAMLAAPLAAQDSARGGALAVGADRFLAGAWVTLDEEGVDDVFAAGASVRLKTPLTGSAHALGRRVDIDAAVGGDVYAAGMRIRVAGPVAGDVTAAGFEVETGAVGGDLRASGSEVTIAGPVAGNAILAAEELRIDAEVAGEAHVTAGALDFGPGASFPGRLILYEKDPGTLEVPEEVVAADRVERREIEEWQDAAGHRAGVNLPRIIASFLLGVIVIAALAALVAAVVPERLAELRRSILARPFGMLWLGFLALSVPIGAAILLAMTLIGIIVSPAAVLIAVLAGFAGYVVGVYALGVGLMLAVGRDEPASIGQRAAAAGIGALAAGLIAAIPFLGWLFVMVVTLAGVGAIAAAAFRPRFGAAPG